MHDFNPTNETNKKNRSTIPIDFACKCFSVSVRNYEVGKVGCATTTHGGRAYFVTGMQFFVYLFTFVDFISFLFRLTRNFPRIGQGIVLLSQLLFIFELRSQNCIDHRLNFTLNVLANSRKIGSSGNTALTAFLFSHTQIVQISNNSKTFSQLHFQLNVSS